MAKLIKPVLHDEDFWAHVLAAREDELVLQTSTAIDRRSLQAAGGYLSGRSARQHFGLPGDSRILALEIRWPDRAVSMIDGPVFVPNSLLTNTRRAHIPGQPSPSQSGSTLPFNDPHATALNGPSV